MDNKDKIKTCANCDHGVINMYDKKRHCADLSLSEDDGYYKVVSDNVACPNWKEKTADTMLGDLGYIGHYSETPTTIIYPHFKEDNKIIIDKESLYFEKINKNNVPTQITESESIAIDKKIQELIHAKIRSNMDNKDKEFLEYLEKGGKPREIDFIPDESLDASKTEKSNCQMIYCITCFSKERTITNPNLNFSKREWFYKNKKDARKDLEDKFHKAIRLGYYKYDPDDGAIVIKEDKISFTNWCKRECGVYIEELSLEKEVN